MIQIAWIKFSTIISLISEKPTKIQNYFSPTQDCQFSETFSPLSDFEESEFLLES